MREKKIIITFSGMVGFFLAIAPVLDPYVLLEIGTSFTIKVNDIIMLTLFVFSFSKSTKFNSPTNLLCFWLVGLWIISTIGNLWSNTNMGLSIKNMVVWLVYAICLTYIWKNKCRDEFLHWLQVIALFASALVIMQFLLGNLGMSVWDGRIPGIKLGKYDGWSGYIDRNTGAIRPNGIFQEASYFGIYVSVAYAQAFKEERIKRMIIYAVSMLLTTSMVSVVLCAIVTVFILLQKRKVNVSSKMVRKVVILIGIAAIIAIALSQRNQTIGDTFTYVMLRFENISRDLEGTRMSSTKYRILGHIALFDRFNRMQKLFGLGASQYAAYFGVVSYSNVWVTILLNFGILGFSYLVFSIFCMARKIERSNRVFIIILLLVFSSDYQWFNWYFFYIISAAILVAKGKISTSNQ